MEPGMVLRENDPLAIELIEAIHSGNLESLQRLLAEHPGFRTSAHHGREGILENAAARGQRLARLFHEWPRCGEGTHRSRCGP